MLGGVSGSMKPLFALVLVFALPALAQQKDKTARLQSLDANKDGKLTKEELGAQFWNRASGYDANSDGVLDAAELAAMQEKGRRGKEDQARPGGVSSAFEVREFKGTNGETIRYSLLVPKDKPAGLPLVLCLHGAGGNTAAPNLLAAPAMQAKHPCIVMAPACDGKSTRWAKSEFRGGLEVRSVMPELIEALNAVIAKNFLFHPLGALPAEGPGSAGVRGEVGGVQGHRGQESPDLAG